MSSPHSFVHRAWRQAAAAALAAGALLAAPPASHAQTAANLYAQTLAQEAAARKTSPAPALMSLRAVMKAYEALVVKFPTSGYSDNALWQAAGVAKLAFDTFADPDDARQAVRLLTWLQKEYPTSSLNANAASMLADLEATTPRPGTRASSVTTPTPSASGAVVTSITRTPLPRGDRVTIEFSQEVTYSGDRIQAPDRVYFDFHNAKAPASLIPHLGSLGGTLVKSMRVGQRPDAARVVLELADTPHFSVFPMYAPFRLVIDVERDGSPPPAAPPASAPAPAPVASAALVPPPVSTGPPPAGTPLQLSTLPVPPQRQDADPSSGSAREGARPSPGDSAGPSREGAKPSLGEPPAPPAITSHGDYSLARQLGLSVSRIVIDAGHGGYDPGAQANGIDEAELVLDVALRVEKLLQGQPGFEVVLTRRTNDFIALEERTSIANRERADLFLSIHANASRQPTARGVETYFLNFAMNSASEAVAARENATSSRTMGNLSELVKTIALNNKLAESRELASFVQTSLLRRMAAQNKTLRDLGVKQAPFVVLIGAQMPSVLAEISFLTNRSEASLLKQPAYRQRIAQALCDALVKYRSSLKKVTTVAAKGASK